MLLVVVTMIAFMQSAVYAAAPTVTGFTPASGPVGTYVTLTGTELGGVTSVQFGSVVVAGFSPGTDGKTLVTKVPVGAVTARIYVLSPSGNAASPSDFVVTTATAPTITGFTPTSGPVGTYVTITGTNFGGATAVKFGSLNATGFSVNTAGTSIVAKVPVGATTARIYVITPAGTVSTASDFTVTTVAAPTITGFTPHSGPVGTYVTITGTNLGGATAVQFGSLNATGFSVNAEGTSIIAKVPVGAVTARIYVLTPGGNVSTASDFIVTTVVLPTLSPSSGSESEGSAAAPGSYTFKVTLSAASTETVTVNYYTTDNTAKAGSDYIARSGTLTFAPGATTQTVKITFIGDAAAEENETFYLDLRSPVNATLASSRGVAYIRNDDGPGIFIDNAKTVDEGNSGTTPQTFTVRLSAVSTKTVTVKWATANGTAGPADYTAAYGTLTFAPGETSKTITILVKGDTIVEPSETYKVNLSSPTFAVLADSQGVAYIRNDDTTAAIFGADEPSQ